MTPTNVAKSKNDQTVTTATTLPWKNSLLTKEDPEPYQNPLLFFGSIITDSDTFSILYEDILKKRELGEFLEYHDKETKKLRDLAAFMVVQDSRGVNWICPVLTVGDPIDQKVCPLNLSADSADDPYRSTDCFGSMIMTMNDYISACSRGFENASRLLLGDESVKLDLGYRLVAVFYIYPKTK